MMADTMVSDSCPGFKRRIAEMENNHQDPLSLHLQEEQGSSSSLCTTSQQDSKDSSDSIASGPESNNELKILDSSPGCSKTVRFPSDKTSDVTEEKIDLGSVCFGSAAEESREVSASVSEKVTSYDMEETDNCVAVSVKEGDKDFVEAENFDEVKEYNADVDMDSANEGDGKENMATSSIVVDESKKLAMGNEVDSETVLEAEKKRLLTELEVGRIFEDKTHVDKIDGLKIIDGNVRSSLKIEVIDDTALIESVRVPKVGNGRLKEKVTERNWKMDERKREVEGTKAKRSKRKVKDTKKDFGLNGMLKNVNGIVKDCNDRAEKVEGGKRLYSREEIEALRFVNIEEQRKMWRDIYASLEPVIMGEYDDLASSKHQKQSVNFDPRQRFLKKPEAPGILGEECDGNMDNEFKCKDDSLVEKTSALPSLDYSIEGEDDSRFVEGECTEDYDSEEEYTSIQKPAFFVEGEPDFDSGPPEDGWEYLRRVRWEAAHIPKVKVAKRDRSKIISEQTVYMPQIPDIAPCPEKLLPLKEWEDSFLADFSELRQVLSGLEDSKAEIASTLQQKLIIHEEINTHKVLEDIIVEKFNNLGTSEANPSENLSLKCSIDQPSIPNTDHIETPPSNKTSSNDDIDNYPTLTQILRMDSVARVSMLRKRIVSAETLSNLSRNDCVWLFALCAAVDTPLDADTSASLRSLLRKCAGLRALKTELDDEVVMLNMLATICGRYFGQSEN